jgi:SAM-dependent methyltransferase
LATQVFGTPLCSPQANEKPPESVLEVACGSGFWSAQCHDYLAESGCLNVCFTGIDVVSIAPDYNRQGINWRFLRHDIREVPFPFEDESFDLIVLKDLSLVVQQNQPSQLVLDEAIRMLRPNGILEIWEVDLSIRSLLPHPPPPPNKRPEDLRQAHATATFLISAATPFGPAQNMYLRNFNDWVGQALDKRRLSAVPCTRMQPILLQEPDDLWDVGCRRVAIPLGEMSWERQDPRVTAGRPKHDSGLSGLGVAGDVPLLTPDQESLRKTALLVVVQLIESLEPLLKEVSGKNQEEWQRWWAGMMTDLFQNDGANNGECLEIGAYWARKRS